MAKLTLADLANLENEESAVATINANSALIEAALEKTLTRDNNTSNPNAMSVDLQMGGKKITGLGVPTASTDAVTKAYVDANLNSDIGDIQSLVDDAEAAATAAAASATTAQNIATGYTATSTTSVAIGTGSKAFTIQTGKNFAVGQYVLIMQTSNPTVNWMFGQITAFTAGTGALTVNVSVVGGSGTINAWTITISGVRGAAGAAGSGSGDVSAPGGNFAASGRVIVSAGTDKTVDDTLVSISGGAVTGVTTLATSGNVTSTANNGGFFATGTNGRLELGASGSTNTPFVDFHSSSSATDYDARLIASGGTSSNGAGTLTIEAATVAVSGALTEGGNPVVNTAGGDNLTGGFTTTAYNIGTLNGASAAYTINPLNGYIQYYSNAGAHELDEPSLPSVTIVIMTNVTGAGTPTLDFDKLTGDTISNQVGRVYELTIRKYPSHSVCNVLRIDV
jgi:hypothetical protein